MPSDQIGEGALAYQKFKAQNLKPFRIRVKDFEYACDRREHAHYA